MKINFHTNGWTPVITDIDLKTASQQESNTIAYLVAKHTVVVIKDQQLEPSDQVAACEKIGKCEQSSALLVTSPNQRLVLGGDNKIVRVGGGNHHGGVTGVFEHVGDMEWHSNRTGHENRDPLIWLYAVKDSAGSRTSWINNILSYQELDEDTKQEIKDLKLVMGYDPSLISEDTYTITSRGSNEINHEWNPNLVWTNQAGITGLYFSFLQIHQILGFDKDRSDALIAKLRKHVEQEKYMYHHDWEDNDVVISEQWLSIHKRWRCENIKDRLLHRIAFNFDHTDFKDTTLV